MIDPAEPTSSTTIPKQTWTITNVRITERTVNKVWIDSNNVDGLRSSSLVMILKGDGTEVRRATVSASNNWSFTFTRLPKYTRSGTEINYTVNEETVPTSYTCSVEGMTVTNTRYTNITVKKKWIDGSNEYNKRPSSVTAIVYNDSNVEVARHAITGTGNDWSYTFEKLPKYRSNGTEIIYHIAEAEAPMTWYGTRIDTVKSTDKAATVGYEFTILNRVLIDIPLDKTWVDNDNPDRPDTVPVVLKVTPVEDANIDNDKYANLTKANGYKYTFLKLPKYTWTGGLKTYTINENPVPFAYKETPSGTGPSGLHLRNDLIVDLSLRKFISAVNGTAVNRAPTVDTTALANGTSTTATYNHSKDPVRVHLNDYITYTIRVYNESQVGVYATEIKDYIPSNLEFDPNNATNKQYGWSQSGNTLTTTYLNNTKINGYTGSGSLNYTDIQLVLRVKDTGLSVYKEKLVNIAQITAYAVDKNGTKTVYKVDRDSKPSNFPSNKINNSYVGNGKTGNYVKGQEDDDDFDVVITDYPEDFLDLSLRKFISGQTEGNGKAVTITADDGTIKQDRTPTVDVSNLRYSGNPNASKTAVYNHIKNTVDVASGDLVTFTIRVYNEGFGIDGYAKEIKDYIPSNLEYVADNAINKKYGWTQSGNVLTTTYLANTKLNRFNGTKLSYADVQVVLKVKTTTNNETLVNIAEITKYGYEDGGNKDVHKDRDSEPLNFPNNLKTNSYAGNGKTGNYVPGQQDDDDFDRVKLTIKDFFGTVWKDGPEAKTSSRDGKLTNNDARFANIRVILHKLEHPDIETKTDTSGAYNFHRQYINYTYKVSFEYPGQEYIPVTVTQLTSGKYTNQDSAASEIESERLALNAKFYEIKKGTARNSKEQNTVALTYNRNTAAHTNILDRNAQTFVNATKIQSHTVNFPGTASYVGYINLGLIEREQANLGVMTDVSTIYMTINGKSEIYNYGSREDKAAVDISYKASDMERKYNKDILKSDYNFHISDYKDNDPNTPAVTDKSVELEVYITYKMVIQNYSAKPAKVSSVRMHYDPTYTYLESWYSNTAGGNNGKVTWEDAGQTNGFDTRTTNSIKNIELAPNQKIYIYVKFQLEKEKKANNDYYIIAGTKYVVTEIDGFTTTEGLVDKNSEPNDINLDKCLSGNWTAYNNTWEDDTDRAPGLTISISQQERTITGFVFEDKVAGQDQYGVDFGNGFKENGEELCNNVVVQLIEKVQINGQAYEYIWQECTTGDPNVFYMDKTGVLKSHTKKVSGIGKGDYKFTDYMPGDYIIRFRYGEKVVDRIVVLSGQDYKYTKYTGDTNRDDASYAKDNKDRRLEVMNYSIDQDYYKQMILGNTGVDPDELVKQTSMYADTVNQYIVGINTENPGHKINFGLIERPKAKLELEKVVKSIKITNKGLLLVDTDNGLGAIKDDRTTYVEVDDELINGANMTVRYELSVKNSGQKDHLYNYFEGDTKYGTNQTAIIKTSATRIYDYGYGLAFDEGTSEYWTRDGIDLSKLSEETKQNISSGKGNVVIIQPKTNTLYKELLPGETTDTVSVTLSRVLTIGGTSDLTYDNCAEIIQGRNSLGRKDAESVFGNYLPVAENKAKPNPTEPDSDATCTSVSEPTGVSQYKPNYVLWITAITTLAIGIILIKVFVLRKKK